MLDNKLKKINPKNPDKPYHQYNNIMKNIYIGNYKSAQNKTFFKKHNIKAVLNCTENIPNYFCNLKIEYMRIPVDDSLKAKDFLKMYNHLFPAIYFIYKHAVLNNSPILIHCRLGRQRSVTCVIAYLMYFHNMSMIDSANFISKKRLESLHFNTSFNFKQTLQVFEKDIQSCKFKKRTPKFYNE